MKKSARIFIAIALAIITYIIGVYVGRNQAINSARLVSDDGDTYVIGYGCVLDNGDSDEELHIYERLEVIS